MAASNGIDRIGPGDLIELVSDVGRVPMNVGAAIFFAGENLTNPTTLMTVLAERLVRVRRLRQCLIEPAFGLGRPYWLDDAHFDIDAHFSQVRCPGPRDRDAALTLTADALTRPLPRSQPLWRALLVTDIADPNGHTALVMVLHHVLADGIGGLSILAHLVDGTDSTPPMPEQRASTQPTRRELFYDNVIGHLRALRRAPRAVARLPAAWTELGRGGGGRAPRCSLNAPIGSRLALETVEVDLDTLRRAGRQWDATINDVLLVAVGGALATILHKRGEFPSELMISVPVSARTAATGGQLGNRVGVMPVRVPLDGTPEHRSVSVSRTTRLQKANVRGLSAELLGPVFRALAAVGAFRRFVDRQRRVNSFLSDLPGPSSTLTVAGVPVASMVPMIVTTGNVAVAFAALSYAGTLTVAVVVDPDLVPEHRDLTEALREQFRSIVASAQ
ncbi:wax ester/triacylglycerol synthase domain-containing protein [Rhodococcus pyridinivorans]